MNSKSIVTVQNYKPHIDKTNELGVVCIDEQQRSVKTILPNTNQKLGGYFYLRKPIVSLYNYKFRISRVKIAFQLLSGHIGIHGNSCSNFSSQKIRAYL